MTQCISQPQLEAFHDGELDPSAAKVVAEHLQSCARCTAELAEIRRISSLLSGASAGKGDSSEMTDIELDRLHVAIDQVISRSRRETEPFPLLKALTALAASMLIIGMAWLAEVPVAKPIVQPTMLAGAPDWEKVAMTLQVDPPAPGIGTTGMAARQDEDLAGWLLQNLQARDSENQIPS